MTIQARIEQLATELKNNTGKRPRRVLCSDETFRTWLKETQDNLPIETSITDIPMSSVKAHAGGSILEFAASNCELEVE
jgi:hypothetical protein